MTNHELGSPRALSIDAIMWGCILALTAALLIGTILVLAAQTCIWPVAPWCSL